MAQTSRTFRIFVSSTFSDLKEERNALQKKVFPRLRELCMQHGCRFQAIDLRWGIREEASFDQQTMKICTEEIQRCQRVTPRPNFIVLLGDRYGWRPLPYEIPAEEFMEIKWLISDDDKELLSYWYKRDENAVPPVYCLQPRTGEFTDYAKWVVFERRLRDILHQATAEMELPAEERVKYTASATEQEIMHGLKVLDANEHVLCFFRTIKSLPNDLNAKDFIDLDEMGNLDENVATQLHDLKENLRDHLPGNVYEYEAEWADRGLTTGHSDRLCEDVYNSLADIILKEIAQFEEVDPLDKEIADHETFGKERAKFFIGRAAILQTMSNYVKGADNHPLAVFGDSGSGKSALMARAVEQIHNDHPKAEIIVRFIGATPVSSDGRALLESLCRQISRCYGADETTIPTDYQELVKEFQKRLALATAEKPLVLFLDALDQLSDTNNARNLIWLPTILPDNVRLIASTLPGECLSVLEKKLPAANIVELDPMHQEEGSALLDAWLKDAGRTLQNRQREEVLSKFRNNGLPLYLKLAFEEARRWKSYTEKIEISPDVPGVIRDMFRRLSSDVNHGRVMISRSLGFLTAAKNGLTEDELLDVLSLDDEVFQDFIKRTYHKPSEKRLPIIVWSRLYFDLEPYLTERSADGTSLLTFYHRQLAEVVTEEYQAGKAKRKRHEGLAQYFDRQPLWIGKEGKKSADLRKMSELPYHLALSSRTDELYKLLTDFTFLELKAATGKHVTHLVTVDHVHYDGIYELIDDFQLALDEWPRENVAGLSEKKESLVALRTILLEKAHIISQYPETIFQSCYNHSSTGSLAHLTENWLIRNLGHNHQWLRKVNRRAHATFGIRLLGHHSSIDSCAFLDNGRFLVSCAGEDPVHVWNAETGQLVTTISLNEREQFLEDGVWHEVYRRPWIRDLASTGNTVGLLELHRIHIVSPTDWKTTSLVLDRGTRAHHLVASEDSFFVAVGRRIWIMDDTGTVKERLLEHEHRRDIEAIAVTPNGSHLASIDYAGMLIVNRHENDKWIPCIEVALQYEYRNPELFLRPIDRWNWGKQKYEGSSFTLGLTPDGRYLALCVNMRIQVFDLRTLRSVCYYQNHKYHTYHTTTISPDGTLVAFGADWRGAFKPVGLLQIHSNDTRFLFVSAGAAIRRAAFSPDGQSLAVGSFDGTISVVKTNQAKPLHSLDEEIRLPDDHILGCIVSIDKKMVACWSIDHRVAVWSLESEELLFTSDRIGESGNDRINMVGFALGGEYLYIEQGYWGDARLTIWRIITGDLVFDTREELLARGEETHFRDNRDRFSCTFSSKSAIAAVTTHRLTFLINLATSNVINIVSSPLGIIQVRMCFDELSNLLAVDSMSIGGGPPPEKTFILRYGTDTFVECDVLPQEVLDSSGIKPVESVNSLSITKHSNLGYVDDHRPGQELFAMLVESGRVVGVFPAEGCVTYIGIIPNKEYVLVGDSAGNLSILKYERRGGR